MFEDLTEVCFCNVRSVLSAGGCFDAAILQGLDCGTVIIHVHKARLPRLIAT